MRRWLDGLPGPVAVAYEAGPTGYGLARALTAAGVRCVVAAPSRLLRPAGDRVKTDARDAEHLGRLLRMDQVVAVRVPEVGEEAARVLVPGPRRTPAGIDAFPAPGVETAVAARDEMWSWWGRVDRAARGVWPRQQRFELSGLQAAFDAAVEAVVFTTARRDRLDTAIEAMAADSVYTPVARRLACLRGISTLTSFALAVEIGDWTRFTGSTIGAYVGLVPAERSSGVSRSQGSITKTGNTHARRLLVEAAWHHARPYRTPGLTLMARWELADPAARARGHAGNRRLYDRWNVLPRPEEEVDRGQRRRGPRTRRLVLVSDPDRPTRPDRASAPHRPPGGGPQVVGSARSNPRSVL